MATGQVDRLNGLTGSLGIKAPVRVASTANIATLSGLLTVDGVTLAEWDRVLVKNQTDGTLNGIYDVQSGAWVRSPDFDGNRDIVKGTAVNVNEGTANAITTWRVTSSDPIVFGTTAITFTAAQYSALSLSTVIHDATEETPAAADEFGYWDSVTATLRKVKWSGILTAITDNLHASTAKTALVNADELGVWDSVSLALRKITWANVLTTVYNAFGSLIAAGTVKSAPVGADEIVISDSEASGATKAVSLTALKTALVLGTGVRQTVQYGSTDSSGYANMLSAGSGLALNLSATAKAMRIAFAAGTTDYASTLSADVTGVVSGLAASNLSYVYADYVGETSVTWGKTPAPVQYGYAFNRAAQALLPFDGAAGSTSMVDSYGNTWTAQGGAKLQTNQVKFGTAALGGAGASNALNGSADYIKTTDITSLGGGSWLLRTQAYITSYTVDANPDYIINGGVSGTFGVGVAMGASGSNKVAYYLSSNGSSWDLASGTLGTTVVSLNAYHQFAIVYDAVAGKYFGYVDGVPDFTLVSASKVCALTAGLALGSAINGGAVNCLNGYIDAFEFQQYCDTPNGATYTPAAAASSVTTAGYSSDFFSIPDMAMYRTTGASVSAGTPPTFTAVNRVYVGETITGAATVSSVVNYALNGRYDSGWISTLPSAGVTVSKNSNIGWSAEHVKGSLLCKNTTAQSGFTHGAVVENIAYYAAAGVYPPATATCTPNTVSFTAGADAAAWSAETSSGAHANLVLASWAYKITANRRF